MSDIIHLLPDSVANQIAAGEVIQRPASAVKELMENAIDAGAGRIRLIVKDAGKALIQVIDDGKGMSSTDTRMAFERHATSKIKKVEDIFSIRTMGFRGEALASIAAIAQVSLKTRQEDQELGTHIEIEGSEFKLQEPCQTPVGSSFSIKNLFFNVPARRNFLKSNPVELKHIIDEFQRLALAHPEVHFSLHHDGQALFELPADNLKVRIAQLLGNNERFAERLVPVEEAADVLRITGYVGKPEFGKRTRGEQFFFVNDRFIRDNYLNHAVMACYENLLPEDSFPLYILKLEIDPVAIDVNVHPTKTEIKFENEKLIYSILRSAVRSALGRHNITPTIDFDADPSYLNMPLPNRSAMPEAPQVRVNPEYNPFHGSSSASASRLTTSPLIKPLAQDWERLFEVGQQEVLQSSMPVEPEKEEQKTAQRAFQLQGKYIVAPVKSGVMVVDQVAAHERILYEKLSERLQNHKGDSQSLLFPQTISMTAADFALWSEIKDSLQALGFQFRDFGKNTLVIDGIPSVMEQNDPKLLIEQFLEEFKNSAGIQTQNEALLRSLARQGAAKARKVFQQEEMQALIDELFSCQEPSYAPNGKKVLSIISVEELAKRLE